MTKIVIKDLDSKKQLTKEEIKGVMGGGFPYISLSRIIGPVIHPSIFSKINPSLLTPSKSTQNTSCCEGYDSELCVPV